MATVRTDSIPTFEELGLGANMLKAIKDLGYEEPTPIQAQTISRMLAGADVIAQAQTGTGKTAAFALPIIERLKPDSASPQALVLTPTRELAVQVAEAFHSYGKYHHTSVLQVYGGLPNDPPPPPPKPGFPVGGRHPTPNPLHPRRPPPPMSSLHL